MIQVFKTMGKTTLIFILLIGMVHTSWASTGTIEGKVTDEDSGEGLPFANVTIKVKGSTLGSVTDFDGYYLIENIPRGIYEVEAGYLGYRTEVIKEVVVKSNKTTILDIQMDSSDEILEEVVVVSYNAIKSSRAEAAHFKESNKSTYIEPSVEIEEAVIQKQINAGQLTAGEIHDFSKWEMWNDLSKNELSDYKTIWSVYPKERYVVQAVTDDGFPVVDAKVSLNVGDKTVWTTKTDNTGKAELWNVLFNNEKQAKKKVGTVDASIVYKGIKNHLSQLKQFKDGINIIKFNQDCHYSKNVDIAFVVDATGSMGDEIDYLKVELLDVIKRVQTKFKDLNIRLGNVFYRDRNEEYLTKNSPLTEDIKESIQFIKDQKAHGGGDFLEAVDAGLEEAVDQLQWSNEAVARILFLVLDAPPHQNDEVNKKLQSTITKAANKGIRIVPVVGSGIDKSTEYLLRSYALATNGHYLFLTDDSGIGGKHIKPSTDSYEVKKLNDLLVDIVTRYVKVPDCNGKKEPVKIDQKLNATVKILPNPNNGLFMIKTTIDLDELFVTDVDGKILTRLTNFKAGNNQVDIANFPTGIYFVRYKKDDKVTTNKVIKR